MSEKQTYIFYTEGMNCASCACYIEEETSQVIDGTVSVDFQKKEMIVSGDFGGRTSEEIRAQLHDAIQHRGYSLSHTENTEMKHHDDFFIAIPIGLVCITLFIWLQKIGLISFLDTDHVSLGTSFVIGLIASVSSCAAVVGGLVLSMSATFAREGDRVWPQALFHIGRLLSFFIFGGIIGLLGAVFQLNMITTFVLSIGIGLIMFALGINLLGVFNNSHQLGIYMPQFISRHVLGLSRINHILTPFIVGVGTFFLPCGFTQSMQIYTLSTKTFLSGGLTMLVFALGTFPALALASFSASFFKEGRSSRIFFKTAGVVVVVFALFNIINGLVVVGVLPPVFHF